MRISLPWESESGCIQAPQLSFVGAVGKKILYLALSAALCVLPIVSLTASAEAQDQLPQITPQQKKINSTKDAGPRALALLQIAPNGKATLQPVMIRIDGRFYDAAAYKANPVPMALESGTVYEGERTGATMGLFTVNGALHSQSPNVAAPWLGTGVWLPAGTELPKSGMKAESVPRGIETSDEPPRLSKTGSAAKAPVDGTPAPTSAPPTQAPQTTAPPSDSKPSRTSQPTQAPSTPPATAPPTAKPADHAPTSPPDQTSDRGDDTNRPRLRRGKPTQPLPADEDIPGYSKPGAALSASTSAAGSAVVAKASDSAAPKNAVQIVPAISDAGGPDPRSYAFEWDKNEGEERRKQMLELAKLQLRVYLNNQAKGVTTASPAVPKTNTAVRKKTSKPPEPELENVQQRTFDIWANNQPILVLTAEAQVPSVQASVLAGEANTRLTFLLIARTDIYSNLHKLFTSITDQYHLDVTPRLELIDVVDADGDGRGELLFRETSDSGSGYVIYRATTDKLWKLFDTLKPE
jgi:hypothetical protein